MNKIIYLFLCLLFIPSPLMAQTTGQDRRIEEEKRQSLEGTAEYISEAEPSGFTPSKEFDADYFEQLFIRRIAFRYDACKTIIILLGLENQCKDIDSQIAFLSENNILPKAWSLNFNANEPLRKGEAAYMFCKVLKMRGGLWIRLFGLSQRYAIRELVYQGIMLPGSTSEIVSGKELILMLTESANYITQKTTEQTHLKRKEDVFLS